MINEEIVRSNLSIAIDYIQECIPYLKEMNGKIPTDILDLIDEINKYSVMF